MSAEYTDTSISAFISCYRTSKPQVCEACNLITGKTESIHRAGKRTRKIKILIKNNSSSKEKRKKL